MAAADRVPFFVRVPGGGGALHGDRPLAAGQTDFAPTLLALLGIDPAPLPYVGRNLLGRPGDPPLVRPYGDWLDNEHLWISRTADHAHACYDVARAAFVDAQLCGPADECRAEGARRLAHRRRRRSAAAAALILLIQSRSR